MVTVAKEQDEGGVGDVNNQLINCKTLQRS